MYKHAYNTEDQEVALRIQSLDYEIDNAHDAYVYTVGPDTFKKLWNQRLRWYYGFIRNSEDYRELFSAKHGILGLFILPLSFISVLLVIAGLLYSVYQFVKQTVDQFIYLRATGYDMFDWHWTFDAFYINLNSVAILGIIAFIVGVGVIYAAKRLSGEKGAVIRPYLWFLATYWFLFGIWWLGAFYTRVRGKRVGWRHKSTG